MANVAYIFITAGDTDPAEQRSIIQDYAKKKNFSIDNYISVDVPSVRGERNRRIQELFANVNRWDTIVVSDLARLGQNLSEIVNLIKGFSERGIRLTAALQDIDLNGHADAAASKAATGVFKMLAELESHFASERIRKALALKKKEGAALGRPKGSISASKLDDKRETIVDYLEKGVSITSLARILETSPSNLLSYLRTRNVAVTRKRRARPAEKPVSAPSGDAVKEARQKTTPKPAKEKPAAAVNHADDAGDVQICRHCGKNILDPRTTTCAGGYIDYADSESFPRVRYPDDEKERCPKCHVSPGGFHHDGCYIERCPRCGERLVSCACRKR